MSWSAALIPSPSDRIVRSRSVVNGLVVKIHACAANVTDNAEPMALVRDVEDGTAWAVGRFDAIAANRIPGIRCAVCWNVESARLARLHNDANVISLGQRMMTPETAWAIVETWLPTPFEGGRHVERLRKIDDPKP